MADETAITGDVYDTPDYTFSIEREKVNEDLLGLRDKDSNNARVRIEDGRGNSIIGRALICKSWAREQFSVTVRADTKNKTTEFNNYPKTESLADPIPGYTPKISEESDSFHFSIDVICDALYDAIFGNKSELPSAGLLLVSGATNSVKSLVARGLVYKYLQTVVEKSEKTGQFNRRPHLVTYEDPIEKRFYDIPLKATNTNIDYTPREKHVDVQSLKAALEDARRQTPSAFYVGEVRDPNDWKEIIHFAGSGHLIVTTSHAGSLNEAMGQIFRFTEAESPIQKGHVAQHILAVVHQRKVTKDPTEDRKVSELVPAVWRRTLAGINDLISDGLSSILPHTVNRDEDVDDANRFVSSLGRECLANWLCDKVDTLLADEKADLINRAKVFDLRGI